MKPPISFKGLAGLLLAIVVGYSVGLLIQQYKPLGIDVSANHTARALLENTELVYDGPADADLQVIAFTDYQCGACRISAPRLTAAAEKDGAVRVAYRNWPIFGELSEEATRIVLAANRQGLLLKLHHALMEERRGMQPAVVREVAENVGVDWAQLQKDLITYQAEIDAEIAHAGAEAFALNLPGTPAYLIGQKLVVGGMNESQFRRVFASARKAARKASAS